MSNRRIKIAETYIKLDLEFNKQLNSELESILQKAVKLSVNKFKHNHDLLYEIDFDRGSTKARVAFFAVLNGLIFYADLKDSIRTVYNDVKWLSEQVIENAKQESPLINNHILRTERRTGYIGKLNTVLQKIEYLQTNLNNLGNNQTQIELNNLYQEVANLIYVLENNEQQTFIQALPQEIRQNLPAPTPKGVLHYDRLFAIKPKDEEEVEDE